MEIRNICVLPSEVFCNLGNTIVLPENNSVHLGEIKRSSTFPYQPNFQVERTLDQSSPDLTFFNDVPQHTYNCFRIGSENFLFRNGSLVQYFLSFNGVVNPTFCDCNPIAGIWREQYLLTNKGGLIKPQITEDHTLNFPEYLAINDEDIFELWVLSEDLVATYDGNVNVRIWRWNESTQIFDLEKEFSETPATLQSVSFLDNILYLFSHSGRRSTIHKLPINNEPDQVLIEDSSAILMTSWKEHICTLHKISNSQQLTIKLWDTEGVCKHSSTLPGSEDLTMVYMKAVGDYLLVYSNGATYAFELTLPWNVERLIWIGRLKDPESPFYHLPAEIVVEIIDALRMDIVKQGPVLSDHCLGSNKRKRIE